jgi:O-antigen ligase
LLASAGTVLPVALPPSQYRRSAQWIHTAALAAGLVLLLSGLVSVQVGLILLSIASVAALPVLVSRHSELLRSTVLWLWVSWWLLWMLSLTWSATPGAAHWDAMWGLVVIPAVMPVAHKPARWLFPVAIGVGLHSLTQATAWSGLIDTTWFTEVRKPFRGLHWYSPYVAVWAMTSMLLMIGAAACKSRRGVRIAALVLAIAAVVGLLLTMNRTSWVVAGAAVVLLAVSQVITLRRQQRQWMLPAALTACLLTIAAAAFVSLKMDAHFGQAQRDIMRLAGEDEDASAGSRFDSSVGRRVLWWNAGWELLLDRPVLGHGAGSTELSLAKKEAELPSEWGAAVPGFITHNPHCSLLSTAIEQGGLGVLLLLGLSITGVIRSWRVGQHMHQLVGLAPAWLALLAFSLTHAVLLEPYTVALISLLVAASMAQRREPEEGHLSQ